MSVARLFVAVRPPLAIRQHAALIQSGVIGARWQSDAQMHITLRFIGEVDRRQGEDIITALSQIRAARLDIALSGVGHFGRKDRLNAIWAGVTPTEAITALHKKVDHALVRTGLAPEARAYLPHLTLARFSASARAATASYWLADHAAFASAAFTADALILYESLLGHDGPVYQEVERFPLL